MVGWLVVRVICGFSVCLSLLVISFSKYLRAVLEVVSSRWISSEIEVCVKLVCGEFEMRWCLWRRWFYLIYMSSQLILHSVRGKTHSVNSLFFC